MNNKIKELPSILLGIFTVISVCVALACYLIGVTTYSGVLGSLCILLVIIMAVLLIVGILELSFADSNVFATTWFICCGVVISTICLLTLIVLT